MQANYVEDQAAFAAVNPKFTVLWGTDFASAIAATQTATQPVALRADLKDETEEVTASIREAKIQLQKLYYYVRDIWPGDAGKYDKFGINQYTKASRNQGKLLNLMELAGERIAEYTVQLTAAGYTAAMATAFNDALAALRLSKSVQDAVKSDRKEVTNTYYTLMNAVYSFMQQLAAARGLAFPDDAAKYANYIIDPEGSTDGRIQKTLNVPMMDVIQYEFPEPIDQATTVIRLENKGVNDLGFAFLPMQHEGPPPATFPIVAGETLERTQSDLAMMGQWIYADNQFSDPGILEVSFVPAE